MSSIVVSPPGAAAPVRRFPLRPARVKHPGAGVGQLEGF
jgi:hypothetical protein